MTAILALDLGTTLGWAVSTFDHKSVFGSGTKSFKLTKHDDADVRYLRFNHFLTELSEDCGPFDKIVFEDVKAHKGNIACQVYGGFKSHLFTWASIKQIPLVPVGVGVWKKSVVGRGNADKEYVIRCMEDRGFVPDDDNEADALAILLYAMKTTS